ncbi:Fpg/Nei family DNA glycosylase [Brevibacillus migulae]|uniref:Fpg/Nei family DNA glycosylase n=1 Tax=Brevibacillus migulae TaxID=1644114 RepID=UPI00106EA287|nr:DNA-formamidopyrimidine glycosylase family protein [Brevibacillus migulae]
MPELPEMETYRRLLGERITGKTITRADVQREKTVNLPAEAFIQRVQGRTIRSVQRKAKHLLFHLDNESVLLLHLMLGGFLYYGSETDKLDRTAQVTFHLGGHTLYFHGLRLGYLHLYSLEECAQKLADLGPEPLDPLFSAVSFGQLLSERRGILKTTLVDQHVLSGIGNCYSDEICFDAGILPMRKIPALSSTELASLYQSMHAVLNEAIRYGGYMEYPLYKGDAFTGGYNERCKIYDRGQDPCLRCGTPIIQEELASRKVFYCPRCQK